MSEQMIDVWQIGTVNWQKKYKIPENLIWQFTEPSDLVQFVNKQSIDSKENLLIIITELEKISSIGKLADFIQPYQVIYNQKLIIDDRNLLDLLKNECAMSIDMSDPQELLGKIALSFFSGQSGIKVNIGEIEIMPSFQGEISFQGNVKVEMKGDFGNSFRPLVTWRHNMFSDPKRRLELALEFQKDDQVDLELAIYESEIGSK